MERHAKERCAWLLQSRALRGPADAGCHQLVPYLTDAAVRERV
jgi:hypothetical protein